MNPDTEKESQRLMLISLRSLRRTKEMIDRSTEAGEFEEAYKDYMMMVMSPIIEFHEFTIDRGPEPTPALQMLRDQITEEIRLIKFILEN